MTCANQSPVVRTLSTNDLIKNLINLLAFKYQTVGKQNELTRDEPLKKN